MKYSKSIIFLMLLLFMHACQSTTDSQTEKSNSMIIDESNYIKISQYNYKRFSIMKNRQHLPSDSKSRSYPGINNEQSTKDLLQISALSSDDQNVDCMLIKQNSTNIVVEVNQQNNHVSISYDDGKKTLKKDMTFDLFQNLEGGAV